MNQYYYPANPHIWQGRNDGDDPSAWRWHQVVKCLDLDKMALPALKEGEKAAVILGFASDEGVRRNKGRTGAVAGPTALRKACANFPVHFDTSSAVFDIGDIVCDDQNLEAAQAALAELVSTILDLGYFPLVLGGGHEVTYANVSGIKQSKSVGDNWAAINFDAHFDIRQPGVEGPSSGTGFYQLAEEARAAGKAFHYLALGIQENSNTKLLFDTAAAFGASYIPGSDFHLDGQNKLIQSIGEFIDSRRHVYLTICLDVFAAAFAPGVSATAFNGILPDQVFLAALRQVLRSGKVVSFDIAELNPAFDIDSRTAKLAASLVFEVMQQVLK